MLIGTKLLWLELKKLGARGLQILAWLGLTLATLNIGVGAAMVLSTPTSAEFSFSNGELPTNGVKLLHLQLFGGIIHIHDNSATGHHDHEQTNKQPVGVVQSEIGQVQDFSKKGISVPYNLYSNYTSISSLDYESGLSRLFNLDYQQPVLTEPETPTLLANQLFFNHLHHPDPFLGVPDKPPITQISFFS